MEVYKQEISGQLLSGPEELTKEELELLEAARAAMKRAYAPYSQFLVGAALRLEDGTIITGNNQENAAFPSGLCAERVAFFSASSLNPGAKIKDLAIIGSSHRFEVNYPVAPCGACRQVMLEYELNQQSPIQVIFSGESGKIVRLEGVKQLLPLFFSEEGLRSE